jgi:hypothetical protein
MEKTKLLLTGLVKKISQSDLARRAAHTFFQAFVATFVAGIPLVIQATDKGVPAGQAALISLATGAVAAGLSALKSALVRL